MNVRKMFVTALCCVMAMATFAACIGIGDGESKMSSPTSSTPAPELPVTEVTEEEWTAILTALPTISNLTVRSTEGDGVSNRTYITQIDGNKQRYVKEGADTEYYYETVRGREYKYFQSKAGEWIKTLYYGEDEVFRFVYLEDLTELFAPLYDRFSYDSETGCYTADNISIDGSIRSTSVLCFADGELAGLNVRYHYDDLTCVSSYVLSDYGTTKVDLPISEGETEIMTDFTVVDTEGEVFQLSQALQDKSLVMIHIWATWFETGKKELSVLQQVVDSYESELAFIGISLTDGYADIEMFRASLGLTLDMVDSKEGKDVIKMYSSNNIPHTIIINGSGEIVYNYIGAGVTYEEWQEIIEICLAGGNLLPDEEGGGIIGPC